MQKVMVIGIAGGTGSGKTTITRRLMQRFGSDVCMISYDNYYKARHDTPFEERAKINYDHPDAFDTKLFLKDLRGVQRAVQGGAAVADRRVQRGLHRVMPIQDGSIGGEVGVEHLFGVCRGCRAQGQHQYQHQ